jgi:hypothetical protein
MYLQQKNIQRLKPKISEHIETKIIFKPIKSYELFPIYIICFTFVLLLDIHIEYVIELTISRWLQLQVLQWRDIQ